MSTQNEGKEGKTSPGTIVSGGVFVALILGSIAFYWLLTIHLNTTTRLREKLGEPIPCLELEAHVIYEVQGEPIKASTGLIFIVIFRDKTGKDRILVVSPEEGKSSLPKKFMIMIVDGKRTIQGLQ